MGFSLQCCWQLLFGLCQFISISVDKLKVTLPKKY
ncbi:MAG: hypothetical protein ACI96N_003482 [Arenicella sp.]